MKKLLTSIFKNNVSLNFFIIVSVALIQLLNTVILARMLDKESYGLYSFLFTSILPLLSSLVIFGQDTSVIRYFSKYNFMDFTWKKYMRHTSAIFLVLICMIVLFVAIFYKLGRAYYICLCFAIFANTFLIFISSFLQSRKKFIKAELIRKISYPIFMIFVGLVFLLNLKNVRYIVTLKTVSYFLPFLFILIFYFAKNKNGTKKIEKNIYFDGLLLWGLGLAFIAMNRVDGFFIVKYIDYKAVAVYSILVTFVQLYDFSAQAIWNIYSQKFSSHYSPNPVRFLSKIGLIAVSVSMFYIAVGKSLLHFLFNGRYDQGIYLLLPLCVVGCLKLIYVYPSCYLIGKSESRTLRSFLNMNILGIVIKVALLIIFIKYFNLLGVVFSGIVAWIYRNAAAYYLITKKRPEPNLV